MAGSLAFIRDELAAHPLTKFYRIGVIKFARDNLLLGLTALDDGAQAACDSIGQCALLVDYGARKLGYESLGSCCVNECEIAIHHHHLAQEWQLQARLDLVAGQGASYSCRVYAQIGNQLQMVASSQGTLIKKYNPGIKK